MFFLRELRMPSLTNFCIPNTICFVLSYYCDKESSSGHFKGPSTVHLEILGLSAGTGNLCIFGHLGLVFIWSCFVSCLLFLLFYVILRNLCSGTHRRNRYLSPRTQLYQEQPLPRGRPHIKTDKGAHHKF